MSLPRTAETVKLKRTEIAGYVNRDQRQAFSPETGDHEPVQQLVELKIGRRVDAGTRIDDLGLGSVDRIELLLEPERHYRCTLDEREFAAAETVGDFQNAVRRCLEEAPRRISLLEADSFPSWNRNWLGRFLRKVNVALDSPAHKATSETRGKGHRGTV
jgi:acyl carrier protein